MDKLQTKLREVEDEFAEATVEEHLATHRGLQRDRALLLVGGFKTALKITTAINSEVMRSLEIFQEEKCHESLGFDRFADFLDNSEHSPMSKAQYYERKALLDKEGDHVFDLLCDLGVSIRKRKLLGKGNVEVDGDRLIVHDGEEVTEIELKDRSRILETLSALADANADKSAKLEKQKESIDRHGEKVRELYDEIDRTRAAKAAEIGGDPHSMALASLGFAFAALREQVAELPPVDREARKANVMEILAGQMQFTAEAYGSSDWTRHAPRSAGSAPAVPAADATDEEYMDALLDQVELEPDANDLELAAQI